MGGTATSRDSRAVPATTASSRRASAATSCSIVTGVTALGRGVCMSVLGVLLGDHAVHRVRVVGGEQAPAEVGVLEGATDPGEGLEVRAGRVLGRDQHEEEEGRLTV